MFNISDGEAFEGMGSISVNIQQSNNPPELNATDLRNVFVEKGGLVA